ncbi:uncharacterized protein BP5553_07137 [Venustampulla echinocandica]|uniref:Rhodanese domain-containing protein n=1 Tax=Venustampulla echinocandica TaxID=2656787 RepID=A0A370TIL8_9HELO|nr:uncharacterized protein BP5553_07137 [Venustampulla echinocandica]RDL35206.1 hypothetical protein BP5553_07137 [Venustampulla echinocandica]
MSQVNVQNVFKGPDSVINYFNPDLQPPLPLVEVPPELNPFRGDNVRIYAKMLTTLPAQNVKMFPALNMLLQDPTAASKSIVEASSGSTALSLSMASRVLWGNEDVCAYVTNKKHPDQLRILRFFGLKVSLYGGLAQQEPHDPRGIMWRLRKLAKHDESVCYPGQYDNDHNWKSHTRWTGPQILQQLPEINVLCTTVGTGGCITGTGVYLKSQKKSVKVVGVCNVFGDPTPGPRHFPGFESSRFPWRDTIDTFESVASMDSYDMSMQMSRRGIICGPSSGEALCGLIQYLQKIKDEGNLQDLADNSSREISCVFICCDLPYQYMDGYFQKLQDEKFPPIMNEILLKCDQDRYDERWELTPEEAVLAVSRKIKDNQGPLRRSCNRQSCRERASCRSYRRTQPTVLDIRQGSDFRKGHIQGSISSPLKNLSEMTEDVFGDPNAIYLHWGNLKSKFDLEGHRIGSKHSPVLILCYDGDISRLATSMLRGRGYTAFGVQGGFPALRLYLKERGK